MKAIGSESAELPELDWGQHLIDSLMEFGPCAQGMSGPAPISFAEIEAWSRMTGISVPGYEAIQLRQLSRDYCNQYDASKTPNEPQPIMPGEGATQKEVTREQVARGFADILAEHKQKADKQ